MWYHAEGIFCEVAGLMLHSSEAFWQLTKFYGHNSELFEKYYWTDYSYMTIWIFGQIVF